MGRKVRAKRRHAEEETESPKQRKPRKIQSRNNDDDRHITQGTKQSSAVNSSDDDIFWKIWKAKASCRSEDVVTGVVQSIAGRTKNIVHCMSQMVLGQRCSVKLKESFTQPVVNMVSEMQLFRTASPFDRRCTSMEWHPTNPNVIAVGSKGGDIILWDIENVENESFIPGRGPGGNVANLKFHPENPTLIYTATLDGRVSLQDFQGKHTQVFLDTMTWDYWYCSVDVSGRRGAVLAGDNVGNTVLLGKDGNKGWSHRLHKSKVTHVEFSPREDWLFCTASTDYTVKLWDVRMVQGRKSALHVLTHDKPINSAYFSLTDGTRLLTTDQNNQLRIYRSPEWTLERTIHHPHRFFQHLTPIKAHWHPLQDLVVVGRYPDPNFPGYKEGEKRTIDVFDVNTGSLVCQLLDPSAPGIISLNKFSPMGDRLASGMGVNILVWCRKEEILGQQEALLKSLKRTGLTPGGSSGGSDHRGRSRPRSSQNKDSKMKEKEKTKTKVKQKTQLKKA